IKASLERFCSLQGASRAARTRVNNCKCDPEVINEKIAAAKNSTGIIGYLDRAGEWIVEKVTDYFKGEQNAGINQYCAASA
uniref:hypothetical protein n=1 Tax=Arsukibacterium sp. TaxID=1977258 RepID=UPI002FDA7DF8